MKNKVINAIFYIIIGLILAIGPYTLFKVCDTTEMVMKCFWSVRAETVLGGLLVFAGVISLILKGKEALYAVNLNSLAIGIAAILVPSKLIGGCAKEMMACRSVTFPSIYIISVIVIVFSIVNVVYLFKAGKGSEQE